MIFGSIIILFVLPFLTETETPEPCLNYDPKTGLCYDCAYTHFRSQNISYFENISLSDCFPRKQENLKLDFFISNIKCTTPKSCNGTASYPFDEIFKALWEANLLANQYISSELNFYFLGTPHFLLRRSIDRIPNPLFRRMNVSMRFSPCYCSSYLLAGCFKDDESVELVVKTEYMYIFVARRLLVRNFIFNGIDLHLTQNENQNDLSNYYNRELVYCNLTTLNQTNVKNNCGLLNRNLVFTELVVWRIKFSLFNVEPMLDDPTELVPELIIENSDIINFYSAKSTNGIASLIQSGSELPKNIILSNVLFNSLRLLKGILLVETFNVLEPRAQNLVLRNYPENSKTIIIRNSSLSRYDNYFMDGNPYSFILAGIINVANYAGSLELIFLRVFSIVHIDNRYTVLSLANVSNVTIKDCIFQDFEYTAVLFLRQEGSNILVQNSSFLNFKFLFIFFIQEGVKFTMRQSTLRLLIPLRITNSLVLNCETCRVSFERCFIFDNLQFSLDFYNATLTINETIFENNSGSRSFANLVDTSVEIMNVKFLSMNYTREDFIRFRSVLPLNLIISKSIVTDFHLDLKEFSFLAWQAGTEECMLFLQDILIFNCSTTYFISAEKIHNINISNITLSTIFEINSGAFSFIMAYIAWKVSVSELVLENVSATHLIELVSCLDKGCSLSMRNSFLNKFTLLNSDLISVITETTYIEAFVLKEVFVIGPSNRIFFIRNNNFVHISSFVTDDLSFPIRTLIWSEQNERVTFENCYISSSNKSLSTDSYTTVFIYYECQSINFVNVTVKNLKGKQEESEFIHKFGFLGFFGSETYNDHERNFSITIKNARFENLAGWPNGVMGFIDIQSILIEDVYFFNCSALRGGGIHVSSTSIVTLKNIKFMRMNAENGGCIYALGVSNFIAMNVSAEYSRSKINGGVLYLTNIDHGALYDTTFSRTSASKKGGIVYLKMTKSLMLVNLKSFYSNADFEGGAIYHSQGSLNIYTASIHSPRSLKGGFLSSELASTVEITGLNVNKALAGEKGVFASIYDVEMLVISDSVIIGSLGSGVGNLYVESQIIKRNNIINKIFNVYFIGNRILLGNCLYFTVNAEIQISSLTVLQNTGNQLYATTRSNQSSLTIKDFVFDRNTCDSDSENLHLAFFQDLKINILGQNRICNNRGRKALLRFDRSVVNMTNFFFFNNSAIREGYASAAIYFELGEILLFNITFLGSRKSNISFSFFKISKSKFKVARAFVKNCYNVEESCLVFEYSSGLISNAIFQNNTGSVETFSTNLSLADSIFINSTRKMGASVLSIDSSLQGSELKAADVLAVCSSKLDYCFLSVLNTNFEIFQNASSVACYNLYSLRVLMSIFFSRLSSATAEGEAIFNYGSEAFFYLSKFVRLRSFIGAALKIFSFHSQIKIEIRNCSFEENAAQLGGAIFLKGAIALNLSEGYFWNNKALKKENDSHILGTGGCVYYVCLNCSQVTFWVYDTFFLDNLAENYAPTIFSQARVYASKNNFVGNKDLIGFTDNISSFPISLLMSDRAQKELFQNYSIVSGQFFSFNLTLVDYQGKRLLFENFSVASVKKAPETSSKLLVLIQGGYSQGNRGLLEFSKLKLTTKPNTSFSAFVSVEFDELQILPMALERNADNNKSITWALYARPCIIGEILIPSDYSCHLCLQGEYSLEDPMAQGPESKHGCKPCPENAECLGGASIVPLQGYWRASNRSPSVIKCFSQAYCLGGKGKDLGGDERFQGRCAVHHRGRLCHACENGYSKASSKGLCEPCRSNVFLFVKIVFALILLLVYVFLQVRFTFSWSLNSSIGILLKQLLTHLQIVQMISVLDLGWTPDIINLLQYQEYISFLSEEMITLDCLYYDIDADELFKKVFASYFLPLAFLLIITLFSTMLFLTPKSFKFHFTLKQAKALTKISALIIIYLFFPEVLKKCFSLINCLEIIDAVSYSVIILNPETVCWESQHKDILLKIGLPGILTWGLIAPSGLFLLLYSNRSAVKGIIRQTHSENPDSNSVIKIRKSSLEINSSQTKQDYLKTTAAIKIKFGNPNEPMESSKRKRISLSEGLDSLNTTAAVLKFIYRGYKEEYYYWELIILAKKLALIVISSFTSVFPNDSKATILLVIISLFLLLQARYHPFDKDHLNNIEFLSLLVTFLSANIGIMLYSADLKIFSKVFMAFLIILNLSFILCWCLVFIREILRNMRIGSKKSKRT